MPCASWSARWARTSGSARAAACGSPQAGQRLLAVANRLLPQLENADTELRQYARGTRGSAAHRHGMPSLLPVAAEGGGALHAGSGPDVDVDVKQKFRFGGIGALLDHEIDLLVTPDPETAPGLTFIPVFDYEQVLVVARDHPLAGRQFVEPQQLADEVLITYPVSHRPPRHLQPVPDAGRHDAARAQDASNPPT